MEGLPVSNVSGNKRPPQTEPLEAVAEALEVLLHPELHHLRAMPDLAQMRVHPADHVLAPVAQLAGDGVEAHGCAAVDVLEPPFLKRFRALERYVRLAQGLGIAATARMAIGTEVVAEAERLCLETAREFPRATFFAGKMIFQRERWWHRLLHNETAEAVQKRLQWAGRTMVTLPVRVREAA